MIEEIRKDIFAAFGGYEKWEEDWQSLAKAVYNAGYRKQNENTVELPCKVGDILYVISQMKDKRILPFINEYEVTSIGIKRESVVIYHEMDGYIKSFKQTDFGRTIFLTKEEAEAKMKGGAE
jgi:hypothetical protein